MADGGNGKKMRDAASQAALRALTTHELGAGGARIGSVTEGRGRALLRTALGSHRILDRYTGEQLPRIC